jgi:Tfp pilus assembly protein FimT
VTRRLAAPNGTHPVTHARPTSPPRPPARRRRPSAAFTLVELLVAMGIIVLMLGLAMPAFRAITGGRSVEGATNQVSAMLSRARADAVGLQIPRGVAFYTDATGQCKMAEVGAVTFQTWTVASNVNTPYPIGSYVSYTPSGSPSQYYVCIKTVPANSNIDLSNPTPTAWNAYWHQFVNGTAPEATWAAAWSSSSPVLYDLVPDTDPVPLPLGVGAQAISDSNTLTGGTRTADAYLRHGVILFDASGRLISSPYVISHYGIVGTAVGYNVDNYSTATPTTLASSFGLVLYDRDAFANQNFPTEDPMFDDGTYGSVGATPPSEADAEAWLDANATPLLINRYTGTLVRGE